MNKAKISFEKQGVNIVEKIDCSSDDEFMKLWKEEGIFGIGFIGHGNSCGFNANIYADEDYELPCQPAEIKISYKLARIIAFSCSSRDAKWDQLLSEKGDFDGFWGSYSDAKEIMRKLNMIIFVIKNIGF